MNPLELMLVLLSVQDVQEREASATIKFSDGRHGLIERKQAEYSRAIEQAREGMHAHRPVAVSWLGVDRISSIQGPQFDIVRKITQSKDGKLLVWLTYHDGIPELARTTPHFNAVHKVLLESQQRQKQVWLAIKLPEFVIMDARLP